MLTIAIHEGSNPFHIEVRCAPLFVQSVAEEILGLRYLIPRRGAFEASA